MAQLSRARDRSMHSIVATIQAEQDKAIRAPAKGVVVDLRRTRHRQDRRGAAPRGVPALHRPASLRVRRRPHRRAQRVSSCATSSGCCPASARPRWRCAPWARSSTGSGRPATTSRRWPTSRARPGWPRCCAGRRGSRRRAAPRSSGSSGATTRIVLDRGVLGRLRRQLMSQGRRNRQLNRVGTALLDAMWRQVRGERGRERGRSAFDDDMLSHAGLPGLRRGLVAAAGRAPGAVLAARPGAALPGLGRAAQCRGPAAAAEVVERGRPDPGHPRGRGRAAARRAALRPGGRAGEGRGRAATATSRGSTSPS